MGDNWRRTVDQQDDPKRIVGRWSLSDMASSGDEILKTTKTN